MKSAEGKQGKPTQEILPIKEVQDGVAVLNDGTLRAMLLVSSLNFALKSEDEQNAIIYAYQDFLNALDFPVQIVVMSRKLDITPYLEELRGRKERQQNELLRLQMNEYINFISELVKGNNIMAKTFLVTVSFSVTQAKQKGLVDKLTSGLKSATGKQKSGVSDSDFEHYKRQLLQRVEQVAVGLRNVGLRVAPLRTQEVLELFYNNMNPSTAQNMRLKNVAMLGAEETNPKDLVSEQSESRPWAR